MEGVGSSGSSDLAPNQSVLLSCHPAPAPAQEFDSWISWDTNPLYALLHEPIYCQTGGTSAWAAQRVRDEHAADFDALAQARAGQPVMFTGEQGGGLRLAIGMEGRGVMG